MWEGEGDDGRRVVNKEWYVTRFAVDAIQLATAGILLLLRFAVDTIQLVTAGILLLLSLQHLKPPLPSRLAQPLSLY